MWASAAAPLKPWQPNAISAAGPSSRCRSVGVHCHRNREETRTLKSEEARRLNDIQLETKGKPPKKAIREKKLELQEQRQFSGIDVLTALQKGTPRKLRTQNRKKEISAVSDGVSNSGIENQAASRFRNLRPLRIKPEWSDRLEELERRLSEVAHRSAPVAKSRPFTESLRDCIFEELKWRSLMADDLDIDKELLLATKGVWTFAKGNCDNWHPYGGVE